MGIILVSTMKMRLCLQVLQKDATIVMDLFWGATSGTSYRNWVNFSPNSWSHSREQAMKETTVPRHTHLNTFFLDLFP